MVKYDDENNYGPWRKYMRVRVEIDMEKPMKQDLVIGREEGDAIKLISNIQDSLFPTGLVTRSLCWNKWCFSKLPLEF